MKRILLIFICIILTGRLYAQSGNEWINFSQSYFKIPVAKDGLYKLDYATLQSAGFPTGIDPVNIQLYHRGIEQSIYVEGEADHQFDPGDYLEFYGQRNDGTLDVDLYKEPSRQPHKYYNLYSDTTSYFLTVGGATGKRMALFSEANGGLPAESYHIDEKRVLFFNQYNTGPDFDILVQYSYFDAGEGWTGTQVTQGGSITNTFTGITNTVPAAGDPELELLIVGRGPMEHFANIYAGGTLIGSINFSGVNSYKFTQTINWATIAADGTLPIRLEVAGAPGADRMSLSYMKLRYPQQLNAASQAEKTFILAPNGTNKSYIEIQNPPANARLFDISDPNSVNRIGTTLASTLNAVVPNTAVSKTLLVNSTTIVPSVKAISFRKITPAQHDYIIISHPLLRKPAGEYADPVKAYAEFRASAAGGSYDTLVVNIGQLFDQFNYGESSPRAIFRFMKYLAASHVPKYLFLIGKGLELNRYNYYRNPPAYLPYRDFVPTSGLPGSDSYFTAGLAGTTDDPAVATGRIPATKPADVAAYLNKVKETTARPFDDLRRKHVLHLSGGIEEGEPEYFRGILESYKPIAEGLYLGGHVSAIAKRSRDIQLVNIAEEVNKGLSLVTFFGHSSAVNLDFDIGFVTNPVLGYNNPGKYPMMIMNGCNVGSFFLNTVVFGEDWINAANKGATGFIAHSSYGLVGTLQYYSEMFYNVAFADSTFVHKGIGDIQKETARRYIASIGSSVTNTTQVQQMVLLGDPAVPLFGAAKSDLEINSNNVSIASFTGEPVTMFTDSFAVKMIIRNFGQARKDTMEVRVKRYLNDNSFIEYDSLYPSVYYSDTLSLVIRKGRENGGGNNRFEVTIDPNNVIDELNENNNSTTIEVPIAVNGTKNLYPTNFSIVHKTDLSLSLQATDILSGERNFILQVDTVNTFASGYKREFTVKGSVLARQTLSLLTKDSLAYYWRTRLAEPLPGESDAWTLSSFTYIQNSPDGWAQVHFPQYLDNAAEGLVPDAVQRKLTFQETVTSVSIRTFGGSNPAPITDFSVKINGAEYNLYTQGFGCARDRFALVAFDRRSTVPYAGVPLKWYENGGRNCGREPLIINNFHYSQMVSGSHDLIEYVNNIAPGDSVAMFSIGDASYQNWPAAAKIKLGELGLSVAQIESLLPGEPVIIYGRKGLAAGQAKVFRTASTPVNQQPLTVDKTITGGYTSGTMRSALIGPALEWQSFTTRIKSKEAQDVALFDIIGVNLKGEEQTLFTDLAGDQDLSGVDAGQYPYIKLIYKTRDDLNLSPAQLRKWLILFTPAPEGLLIFKSSTAKQVFTEGATWKGSYGFVNISDKSFTNPLSVQYELFNQDNRQSLMQHVDIEGPAPGDTTLFDVQFSTTGKVGLNDVNVYVNPHIVPEQYYDNNLLALPGHIEVSRDIFKPVLDVTIDGRHVEHGDFVSPNPLILVKIWDENRNLLKSDTTGVRIFLTYPCAKDCQPTQILLTGTDVVWSPATLSTDFTVAFRPRNLMPGSYVLMVEAADSRSNNSGAEPYRIDFEVKSDLSINVSDPYPNPSVLDVTFNVALGGSELPSEFTLSLMDVNGKLIRMFAKPELDDFHTGINYLTWNGTDTNGTRVPAGVYVYKIQLSMQGQHVTKNGKIVLLR